ncbi:MAG: PAS domain-containing sensor histidine kinase [Alphaproteobacteria bacterium]|nr:PAS domain-containing sensor histidine kinase [Alphaproteobacteria bacterium]
MKNRKNIWMINLARGRWRDKVAVALSLAALVLGATTYAALTRTPFFGNDATTVMVLLGLDLFVLFALGWLVLGRIYRIWRKQKKKQMASRLHVRMVSVFTMLAAAPALLVVFFAAIFFYFGVEAWFSERVSTALDESQEVAQAYLQEHQQVLRADALAMANDLNRQALLLAGDSLRLSQAVSAQAYLRSLTEVIVFDGTGKILARSGLTFALSFEPITDDMRARAKQGEVVLVVSDNDDRVRALLRLDNFVDTYLFVGRLVEPKVMARIENTQKAVSEYHDLREHSSGLRVMVSVIFVVVALLLLLTAVWIGLNFASSLMRPISALMDATERVRRGDLSARLIEERDLRGDDELASLGRAFNRMTEQLAAQRTALMVANQQLDLRRRFTEAVLTGVSAGVIGLDGAYRINMMNARAASFFALEDSRIWIGRPLAELSPEIDAMIRAHPPAGRMHDGQVEIKRAGQTTRTLLVRISSDLRDDEVGGFVVTFDDVSELVSAQRKAAWADVARRIAHEIKNPLTPIQLSAERLRRKYMNEVSSDPQIFDTCIETIIRHVEDIGSMVDEFSAFARMPTPVIKRHELVDLCRQTLFLQSATRTDITYTQNLPKEKLYADCDSRQLAQALTNLLKNAAEAIDGREKKDQSLPKGRIILTLKQEGEMVVLSVTDNGCGLPVEERARLTEPYVTTRSKGTGLGLAIVKKIMEDHHGNLALADHEGGGAVVSLIWPQREKSDTINDMCSG